MCIRDSSYTKWKQISNQMRFFVDGYRRPAGITDDGKATEWVLPALPRDRHATEDYAIVSRVFHPDTHAMLVEVAGVTQYGTDAAADLITNPELMAEALRGAPSGWQKKNLQLVLHVKVISGAPRDVYKRQPLFRPASIRGLLNRHRLRKADATLLTAVVDRPLPYGRIIRDAAGNIVDIIEDAEAGERVRAIRELNVGAYALRADVIPPELPRLTDCVHGLIRAGLRVESYQIYDPDEVQGINNPDDLARAEVILRKRLYRPHREEEQNLVRFGTGGWRAVIGEGFTMHLSLIHI